MATKKKSTKSAESRSSVYNTLVRHLRGHNPWGADAQLAALKQLYPNYDVRAEQLRLLLKQMGVQGVDLIGQSSNTSSTGK